MSMYLSPNSDKNRLFGSTSCPSSILKKCKRQSLNVPGKKVRFNLFNDIKHTLTNYDNDKIYYNNIICDIRDLASVITDYEFIKLLKDARNCVNILNEKLKLFVQVILIMKWMNRSDEAVSEYRGFLLDVCTAYNCHTKFAIDQLISCFSNVNSAEYNHINIMPSEEEERGFKNVHITLKDLLKVIPLAKDLLMTSLQKKFPYKKNYAKSFLYYIHNLLHISLNEPSLRKNILSLIVNKLVEIDVHISKEELHRLELNVNKEIEDTFSMDIDINCSMEVDPDKSEEEYFSHILDICLGKIFVYMNTFCHDSDGNLLWGNTKSLYHDLLSVFENEILPTYNSSHIQYVIYYFLSFKTTLAERFSNWLWKKCCDVSSPSTLRQAAAGYLASFLCRALFVSNNALKNILFEMSSWCNNYIDRVDTSVKVVTEDLLKTHAVFYSLCQALFYIISFRHQDLTDNKRNLWFMENLNLSKMVTCRLSPLRLCCSTVVNRFAHITKTYQLAYCYAVMDDHIRVADQSIKDQWLYSFFPFDSYVLPQSRNMIIPDLFREFDSINQYRCIENNEDKIPLSFPDNMNISSNMFIDIVLSPSPAKTDWLEQFDCRNNKTVFY